MTARIGSTDIGPICGLSNWSNARDVFERMVYGIKAKPKTVYARGHLVEPMLRELYRDEYGACSDGIPREAPLLHRSWEFASCSPDGLSDCGEWVVEFKTATSWTRSKWGEPNTDQIPPTYLAQLAWCLAITERPRARLLCAFGRDLLGDGGFEVEEVVPYVVQRDMEFEELLKERAEQFWVNHVVPRVAPDIEPLSAIKLKIKARLKNGR